MKEKCSKYSYIYLSTGWTKYFGMFFVYLYYFLTFSKAISKGIHACLYLMSVIPFLILNPINQYVNSWGLSVPFWGFSIHILRFGHSIATLAPNRALMQTQHHNMGQPHSWDRALMPLMTKIEHIPPYDAGELPISQNIVFSMSNKFLLLLLLTCSLLSTIYHKQISHKWT